ncbi:MAG: hypothetical protein JOY56_12380 [Solirubrobacterales bacterium]|nr:hypothetical protein [Solirubrobacterales bacterium]
MAKLNLHGCAASGKGPFDLRQYGCGWHSTKAPPRNLVQRRALFREAGHTTSNGHHEAPAIPRAMVGGFAASGDELRLSLFNALG